MENLIGTVVAYWFVTQVWLTGAAVVVWLAWVFGTLVRSKYKRKGKRQ